MRIFGFLFGTFVLLFSGVVFLSVVISRNLNSYYQQKEQMATELDFKARLGDVWEWIPFTGAGEEKVARWQTLQQSADAHYANALAMGLILVLVVALFAGINLLYYRNKPQKWHAAGLVMVFSSMSFLYLGLQSPFMEIEAFNRDLSFDVPVGSIVGESLEAIALDQESVSSLIRDLDIPVLSDLELPGESTSYTKTFEGRIYYFYQNKSIMQLLSLLYTGGNFFVAICLLFFSIIFPVVKLVTSTFVFMYPHSNFSRKAIPVIKGLGKWSMADVFVASIFLSYFAFTNMNVGVDTGSTTLIGTYFFVAFVLLSIASGTLFSKVTKTAV
jgi:hypothetical protein